MYLTFMSVNCLVVSWHILQDDCFMYSSTTEHGVRVYL
jgi:hypothetical protein